MLLRGLIRTSALLALAFAFVRPMPTATQQKSAPSNAKHTASAASEVIAQAAPNLDVLHGEPGVKTIEVQPGIDVTIEYGSDGVACHMVIEPRHALGQGAASGESMSTETATAILNRLVPNAIRGRQTNGSGASQSSCADLEYTIFENVVFSQGKSGCLKPIPVYRIGVGFRRGVCKSSAKGPYPPASITLKDGTVVLLP